MISAQNERLVYRLLDTAFKLSMSTSDHARPIESQLYMRCAPKSEGCVVPAA
jgi:hypothetical protein